MALKRDSKGRFLKAAQPGLPGSFRFFDLPPELRNRIYRYVLVSPSNVHLEGPACMEPGVLRSSRQLRQESASIYYSENIFDFTIRQMSGAKMLPFRTLQRRYRSKSVRGNFYRQLMLEINWSNLMEWMQCYHSTRDAGLMLRVRPENEQDVRRTPRIHAIVETAFAVVHQMRRDKWEKVEKVMKAYHKGLALANVAWA